MGENWRAKDGKQSSYLRRHVPCRGHQDHAFQGTFHEEMGLQLEQLIGYLVRENLK